MALAAEAGEEQARLAAAHAACHACHSGTAAQPVLCLNGDCPVLYVRFSAEDALRGLAAQLARLEW